ncbi:MAG TPA: hypothetical protein VHB73_03610 [Alphaproteobacteria bacterium]|nr:hypothetical protein [Alphaproteobacteria bacterium]
MQTHFILLAGARGVLLLRRFGQEEEKAWILPSNNPALLETLTEALKEKPYAPLRVVLDGPTLDLRREGLPPVNPMARHKIIQRQGSHHFAKNFLRGAGSWREGGAFYALHAACGAEPNLEALLQKLHGVSNPLEALSFFAAEWPDYAVQIAVPPPRPWSVALVLSEAMGLRQIALKDGKAAFTRLHEECVPSLGAEALVGMISLHLRSMREFLPRLEAGTDRQAPALLFVPSCLESLANSEELRGLDCRVVVLKAAQASLLPAEWEADIVWAGQAGEQALPLVPLKPFWIKERLMAHRLRQVVVFLMMALGLTGIYMGSKIIFTPKEQPPPAVIAPKKVDIAPTPPSMHLEAVIYNGEDDWSVWINGQKFTAAAPAVQNIQVTGITPDGVAVHWQEAGVEKNYLLRQENAATSAVQ